MRRGTVEIGMRVLAPAWLFDLKDTDRPVEATVTKLAGPRWRGEVNIVEVERDGQTERVNVCYLEPAP